MLIKDIFEKPIDRNIDLVIKANDPHNLVQEFEEYVITEELLNHFKVFFQNFVKEINNPLGNCGVWISGFYGSGKSHFLKILSYILNNKFEFEGKKPIDFFIKDNKINDKQIISNMENSIDNNDVILFNIASKASNNSIKDVFIKVFNQMRGYSKDPFIANFEKKLDKKNKLTEFIDTFNHNGGNWLNERDYLIHTDNFIKSIVEIGCLTDDEAQRLIDSRVIYEESIEDFALDVKEYCMNNHRVIFAVDEIGQFIGDDIKLMLELQAIIEEFAINCEGQAWIIVTSQQQLSEIIKDHRIDFTKIQGRFNTKISLSSSDVDEIIKWRILDKNSDGKTLLSSDFDKFESSLKNMLQFKESSDKKIYNNVDDFVHYYPFIPYHFDLIQKSLIEIRSLDPNSSSVPEGERSLIEIFQNTLKSISNRNVNKLMPLYKFYESFSHVIDSTVAQNMRQAQKNKILNNFDRNVLKTLYLIKYLDDAYLKPTIDNLTVLMISEITEDILSLRNKIVDSLDKLIEQVYVHKNGNLYYYLTKKEQDVNLKIRNQVIDTEEIPKEILKYINDIYPKKKLKFDKRYSYKFNQIIDNEESNTRLVIRYITSYFENNDSSQTTLDNDNIINFKHLSEINNEVVVYLNQNQEIYNEISERLKIEKFLSDKVLDKSRLIECQKRDEAIEKSNRTKILIEEAIKDSIIYINGNKFNFKKTNPVSILDESLNKLFSNIYNKWSYMEFYPSKKDIKDVLTKNSQSKLLKKEDQSNNALNDLEDYISNQSSPVSLKDIIIKYMDAPYGYVNEDISWIIANLFAQKRISLLINDEELFLNENTFQKSYDYITAGKSSLYAQNLLISKRITIPKKQIKLVKNLLNDLSDEKSSFSDEELMVKFKEILKINNEKINDYIREIQRCERYPGLNILEKYAKLSEDSLNKKNLADFYSFIYKNNEDFEQYIDDLNDIFNFFEGNQREIFDNSCKISDEFNQNEMLINDTNLKNIVEKINSKISMEKPYDEIKNLSDLNNEYFTIFDDILECEHKKLLESIDYNYNYLIDILSNDSNLEDLFYNEVENKFNKLKRNLVSDRNIHSIRGKINASNDIKNEFIKRFNEFKVNNPINSGILVDLNDLLKDEIDILNEDDIETFLESIKIELQKELEKNKSIKIISKY